MISATTIDNVYAFSTSTPSATRTLVASTTVTKVLLGSCVGSGMRSMSMGRPRIAFRTIKAPFFEETRLPSLQDGLSTPMNGGSILSNNGHTSLMTYILYTLPHMGMPQLSPKHALGYQTLKQSRFLSII